MGQVKKAIICPSCGRLISGDAPECIHCGLKNPGRIGALAGMHRLFRGNLDFTTTVIYFCTALYILSLLIDVRGIFHARNILSFLEPSQKSILIMGATGSYPIHFGRYWTLVTAIFLHGSILHIIFNMLWVRQIGPMVEEFFGIPRLIIIFLVSGIAGFALTTLRGTQLTIGASGAIFGLLAALIYYGRARGGLFRQFVYPQILTWAIVLFIYGFLVPQVDNLSHLGGFIAGYLSASLLGYRELRPENLIDKVIATALIIVVGGDFIINFGALLLTLKWL
ncbi:MAG: rhomboid family intramembrane serine protease [candidate division KSB1 bacterium]|nr:rhomboid family intramembrane serine protease [candidate division KSB1 bacterium]